MKNAGIIFKVLITCFFLSGCDENSDEITLPVRGEKVASELWLARESVKVAAGQVTNDDRAYDIMLSYIDSAARAGADLMVLPEYLAGTFSLPLKDDDPISQIAEAARRNHIYVIVGGWEEFEEGAFRARKEGAFANTALVFSRKGEVIGKYSKMHEAVGKAPHWWPPLPDQAEWLMKAGEEFPVFQLDFGRIGIMICYDGYFPEPAEILSLHGAEIIVWINSRGGAVEEHLVKADIQRNYVAVVATNTGQGAGTMIAQNTWRPAARVDSTGNHFICADIDLEGLRERRAHSRIHHQRKPGLYEAISRDHDIMSVYKTDEE